MGVFDVARDWEFVFWPPSAEALLSLDSSDMQLISATGFARSYGVVAASLASTDLTLQVRRTSTTLCYDIFGGAGSMQKAR
jgi:hypothetical protein